MLVWLWFWFRVCVCLLSCHDHESILSFPKRLPFNDDVDLIIIMMMVFSMKHAYVSLQLCCSRWSCSYTLIAVHWLVYDPDCWSSDSRVSSYLSHNFSTQTTGDLVFTTNDPLKSQMFSLLKSIFDCLFTVLLLKGKRSLKWVLLVFFCRKKSMTCHCNLLLFLWLFFCGFSVVCVTCLAGVGGSFSSPSVYSTISLSVQSIINSIKTKGTFFLFSLWWEESSMRVEEKGSLGNSDCNIFSFCFLVLFLSNSRDFLRDNRQSKTYTDCQRIIEILKIQTVQRFLQNVQ